MLLTQSWSLGRRSRNESSDVIVDFVRMHVLPNLGNDAQSPTLQKTEDGIFNCLFLTDHTMATLFDRVASHGAIQI